MVLRITQITYLRIIPRTGTFAATRQGAGVVADSEEVADDGDQSLMSAFLKVRKPST